MICLRLIILVDLEEWITERGRAIAWWRGRKLRAFPCKKCGLFGCVCQSVLSDFGKPKPRVFRDRCPVCGLFLCDCPRDARGERL